MKPTPTTTFALLATACLLHSPRAGASESVWISSLDLTPVTQGWGKAQSDKSVTGKTLSIAGKTFEHGVGTHADSVIRLDLKAGSERFSASVGVDDAAGNASARLVFKVVGDGKTLWKSGVMKLGQAS